MRAQLIDCREGQVGTLIVDFPLNTAENNELHIHPFSDRVITIILGSGEFVVQRPGGAIERFPLEPGDRVWMPRGILHTFVAGEQGLLVESLHNPFIPLEDERALMYKKQP
jgi:quercetin dioxygenase-like cupin family protein